MIHRLTGYIETKLVFLAVLIACLCIAATLGFYQHVTTVRAGTDNLIASNLRARHLVQLLTLVQNAETGQRGYLLTGRDEYLQPYVQANSQVDQSLLTLQKDYTHNDFAKQVIISIEQQVRAKFTEMKSAIEARQREGLEAALSIVQQDTGKRLMDAVHTDVGHLLEAERTAIDRSALWQRDAAKRDATFWVWMAPMILLPVASCLLFAFRDARRGRREGARLAHASSHDPLTGLLNRSALLDQLDAALLRRSSEVGLLYLDLNDFKAVNDSLGHAVGDRLLIAAAQCLRETLRPVDAIARIGGDEFVVVVERCSSPAFLLTLAKRVEVALEAIRLPELGSRRIGGSVGIAHSAEDASSAARLLEVADTAMYKRKGHLRQIRVNPSRSHLSIV